MAITGLLCADKNLERLLSQLVLLEELYLGMVTDSPVLPILSHPQPTEKTDNKESQNSLYCRRLLHLTINAGLDEEIQGWVHMFVKVRKEAGLKLKSFSVDVIDRVLMGETADEDAVWLKESIGGYVDNLYIANKDKTFVPDADMHWTIDYE